MPSDVVSAEVRKDLHIASNFQPISRRQPSVQLPGRACCSWSWTTQPHKCSGDTRHLEAISSNTGYSINLGSDKVVFVFGYLISNSGSLSIDADAERIIRLEPTGVQPCRVMAQLAVPIIVARQDFWYRALCPMSSSRLATTTLHMRRDYMQVRFSWPFCWDLCVIAHCKV